MTAKVKSTSQPEVWDDRRLRVAADAAGVALWSWNVDSDHITMDKRAFELWGLPHKDEITFEELSTAFFQRIATWCAKLSVLHGI